MNIQTVGMENLPNVFIDEIFIYSSGDALTDHVDQRIVVRLGMHDHHPNRSWMRPEMSVLQVKIVFLSGTNEDSVVQSMGSLEDGSTSLQAYEQNLVNSHGHGAHVLMVGTQDFVPAGGEGEYRKFKKTIEITMDRPENLSVYAACFIGDLNLGNDLLNKFYGPMSAEKIYVGGEVNRETSYFYYPDTNEEYGGPVHGHEDTWMEGSKHSTKPHKELRRVIEENYKIKTIKGITDPNEFLPDIPGGPQTGTGEDQPPEDPLPPADEPLPPETQAANSPSQSGLSESGSDFDGSQDISGDLVNQSVGSGTGVEANTGTGSNSTNDPSNQEPGGY